MGAQIETPPPLPATDVFLAASIARRFYLENRSKSEIANEFRISRFNVARVLAEGVAQGIRTAPLLPHRLARPSLTIPKGAECPAQHPIG